MSTNLPNNMGAILWDWRERSGASQSVIADRTGVSRNTLLAYEKGNSKPSIEFIDKFSRATGAPLNMLLACLLSDIESSDAQSIVHMLEGGKAVEGKQSAKTSPILELGDVQDDGERDFVMVPRYEVRASAGNGSVIHSEQIVDYLAFRSDWIHKALGVTQKDLALIEVHGDSMEPTLSNGDLILLDMRHGGVIDNSVYAIQLNGGLLVKRIQRKLNGSIIVKSDNPRYEPESLEPAEADQLRVVGRVVWSGRRM